MIELNEQNFAEETQSGLILVDFWAEWCGPCRMLAPLLETLTGARIGKVDCQENQTLAQNFNVSAIPCVVFLKDGKEVDRVVGLASAKFIQAKIDAINNQVSKKDQLQEQIDALVKGATVIKAEEKSPG